MFPLCFSSSSSLSSIPPSLDSISELDRVLSDISEDEGHVEDTDTTHTLWSLPSHTLSLFTDQQLADLEHLAQNSVSPPPFVSSPANTSELLSCEEGRQVETRTAAPPHWRRWFSLAAVFKCASFVLCFLSVSGNGSTRLPTKIFSEITKKLNSFTSSLSKLASESLLKMQMFKTPTSKYNGASIITPKIDDILNTLACKWSHTVTFLTRFLPPKFSHLIAASQPTQLRLPSASSFTCSTIASSFPSFSSLPFSVPSLSSCPLLTSFSCSKLNASVHRYLLNPSPLFLPSLLVTFLLVVMVTASQSLALALILATPLGLTLYYLENVVSSQRKAVLPPSVSDELSGEHDGQLISGSSNTEASPLTPAHTPPRIRHLTGTAWMQEMCDPAA